MKDELFQELLASVKQGAAIMKGTMQPFGRLNFQKPRFALYVSNSVFHKISLQTLWESA